MIAVLIVYLATPPLSRTAAFRDTLQRTVLGMTGFSLEIDDVQITYDLSVVGHGLRLGSDRQDPFLTIGTLHAAVSAKAIVAGSLVGTEIETAHLYLDRLPASSPATLSAPETEQTDGARSHPAARRFLWAPLRLHLDDSFVHHGASTFGPLQLDLEVSGRDTLTLAGTSAVVAAGNQIAWSLSVDGPPIVARGEVHGAFADLVTVLRSIGGIALPDGVVAAAADVTATGQAALRPDGGVDAKVDLTLDGLDAHDAESTRILQGAKARAALEGSLAGDGTARGRLDLSTAQGELLWGLFYANLAKHPVGLQLAGTVDKKRLHAESFAVRVENLATLGGNATSRLDGSDPKLDIRLTVPDIAPVFDLAVREPFKQSYPILVNTQVAGQVTARVSYESGQTAKIAGWLDLEGGGVVSDRASFHVEGLNIEIPFRIGNGANGKDEHGLIAASRLSLGGVGIESVQFGLTATPNRVVLRSPVDVPVLGGTFTMAALSVEELGGPRPHARAGIAIRDIDLRALSEAMGWPAFGGSLSGAIPDVTIAEDHVRSDGQIEIEVFGGTIRARNLRLDQILSPVPELSLDLDFQNLSLKKITKTFGVGHVSGVVNGAFERLVIVKGQPVSFDAWLETKDTRGVSQKISVKALRQISILGGSGGDAITRGILSLFDEYGYAKMGFRCRLQNDRFVLEGVESKDGKEYLIVGSFLPPKVDVVSHSQVISFSEMMRRLERATAVGATPKPVDE